MLWQGPILFLGYGDCLIDDTRGRDSRIVYLSLQTCVRQEMDAMRERKGTFEVLLTNGERMESSESQGGGHEYHR